MTFIFEIIFFDQGALSFHKFEKTDPINTYNTWFKSHDQHLMEKYSSNSNSNSNSNETKDSIVEKIESKNEKVTQIEVEAPTENNVNTQTDNDQLHQEL